MIERIGFFRFQGSTLGNYTATVGPHNETMRINVASASASRLFVSYVFLYIRRATSATTPGLITIKVQRLPNTGDSVRLYYLSKKLVNVDDTFDIFLPFQLLLGKDQGVAVTTSDTSDSGTVEYRLTVAGYEFM
jgi:hypothetical protein